jgi:hypothetical protein
MEGEHTKIALMSQDIQYIKEEISEIKSMIQEHADKEDKVWEDYMNRKANKWVESALVWAIAGIVAAATALVWAVTIKKTMF